VAIFGLYVTVSEMVQDRTKVAIDANRTLPMCFWLVPKWINLG